VELAADADSDAWRDVRDDEKAAEMTIIERDRSAVNNHQASLSLYVCVCASCVFRLTFYHRRRRRRYFDKRGRRCSETVLLLSWLCQIIQCRATFVVYTEIRRKYVLGEL